MRIEFFELKPGLTPELIDEITKDFHRLVKEVPGLIEILASMLVAPLRLEGMVDPTVRRRAEGTFGRMFRFLSDLRNILTRRDFADFAAAHSILSPLHFA